MMPESQAVMTSQDPFRPSDVICPVCRGSYHETTERFDPDRPCNGAMFRLKKFWRDNGWNSFTEMAEIPHESCVCPACGWPYGGTNGMSIKLRGAEPPKKEEPKGEIVEFKPPPKPLARKAVSARKPRKKAAKGKQ